METRQQPEFRWSVALRQPGAKNNAAPAIITPSGDQNRLRWVITFNRKSASDFFQLFIRTGHPGKLRFNYLKLEELPRHL